MYGSLATPDTLATERIRDAVRAARLLAQREGAPASVIVDPARGDVYALGLHLAGNWHFEDDAGTGWPVPSGCAGCTRVPRGVIGSAVRIAEDGEPSSPTCRRRPRPDGFAVRSARGRAASDDPAQAWPVGAAADDENGWKSRSGSTPARPGAAPRARGAPPDRSPRSGGSTAVLWSGRDGRRAAGHARPPRRMAPVTRSLLRAGEGLQRFRGLIDELRLSAVASEQHAPLPAEVHLLGEPRVLHLDPQGRLDPDFHGAPEDLAFTWGDPARRTHVELGVLGSVRSWTDVP